MKFEDSTETAMNITIFWNVKQCILAEFSDVSEAHASSVFKVED
jgi:hypothetical protein